MIPQKFLSLSCKISYLAVAKVGVAGQLHERDANGVFIEVKGTLGVGSILVGALAPIDTLRAKPKCQRRREFTQFVDVYVLLGWKLECPFGS